MLCVYSCVCTYALCIYQQKCRIGQKCVHVCKYMCIRIYVCLYVRVYACMHCYIYSEYVRNGYPRISSHWPRSNKVETSVKTFVPALTWS